MGVEGLVGGFSNCAARSTSYRYKQYRAAESMGLHCEDANSTMTRKEGKWTLHAGRSDGRVTTWHQSCAG